MVKEIEITDKYVIYMQDNKYYLCDKEIYCKKYCKK